MADAVVELRRVSRVFATDPPIIGLTDVDLTVERGESVAVVGPSGSGKSTLLNIIGCLDRPTSGAYRFDGVAVDTLSERERAFLRGRRIGFVFQSFHLLSHRSAAENVMLAELYLHTPRAGRRERSLAALERVGLSHRAEARPTRLSGGERQRVAIARALVGKPDLLLCDEPTGNLDSHTAADVLGVFEDLHRDGLTIVMITHDERVAAHAERAVRIVDGRLSASSMPDHMLALRPAT